MFRLKFIFILLFTSMGFAQFPNNPALELWVNSSLDEIYREYPVAKIALREQLLTLASGLFEESDVERMRRFMDSYPSHFLRINHEVKKSYQTTRKMIGNPPRQATAVISGRSIVGMVQALILQRQGYKVSIFDTREKYTRNIQWAVRESLISMLNLLSTDNDLSSLINEKVMSKLDASYHINTNGELSEYSVDEIKSSSSLQLEQIKSAKDMLSQPSVLTTQTKMSNS